MSEPTIYEKAYWHPTDGLKAAKDWPSPPRISGMRPGESQGAYYARMKRLDQQTCGEESGHTWHVAEGGVKVCVYCDYEPDR